jgi:hypothetical protein
MVKIHTTAAADERIFTRLERKYSQALERNTFADGTAENELRGQSYNKHATNARNIVGRVPEPADREAPG